MRIQKASGGRTVTVAAGNMEVRYSWSEDRVMGVNVGRYGIGMKRVSELERAKAEVWGCVSKMPSFAGP